MNHFPQAGGIWVCKPAWWRQVPWDIAAYALGHPGYPDRIHGEEIYDVAEFDAYRNLGIAAIHHINSTDVVGFRGSVGSTNQSRPACYRISRRRAKAVAPQRARVQNPGQSA